MKIGTIDRHIEVSPDVAGGKPRIAGHRIKVQDVVVWHERMGKSADEISAEHDISIADVYAALTYYFDHRDQIERDLRDSEAFVEELRQRTPSKLWQKLHELGRHEQES